MTSPELSPTFKSSHACLGDMLQSLHVVWCWREDFLLTGAVHLVEISFACSEICSQGLQVLSRMSRRHASFTSRCLVLERGLEPPQGLTYMVLSHARLPISPLQHECVETILQKLKLSYRTNVPSRSMCTMSSQSYVPTLQPAPFLPPDIMTILLGRDPLEFTAGQSSRSVPSVR